VAVAVAVLVLERSEGSRGGVWCGVVWSGEGDEGGEAAGGRGIVRGRGLREEGCSWPLVLQRIVSQDWLPLSSLSHSSLCHWLVFLPVPELVLFRPSSHLLPLRLRFLQAFPPCAVETPIGVSVEVIPCVVSLEFVEGLERPCGGGYFSYMTGISIYE
jgi:hypothetical protein